MKKDKYGLPLKWVFTTTKENVKEFHKLNKTPKHHDQSVGNHYCINDNGRIQGWMYHATYKTNGYTPITFEQWKRCYIEGRGNELYPIY